MTRLLHAAALLALLTPAQTKPDFSRWEKEVSAVERRLKDHPPPKGAVVFAGSSTIRLWKLEKYFPGVAAVNVGFGGSEIADCTHFAPRLVLPHEPRVVVLYAGDNDLAAGKTPERVLADFKAFARVVHGKLPKTRVVFLSIKPSLRRWHLVEKVKKANALVEGECKKDSRLRYVDVFTPMLGKDGKPRRELFADDGLHLSDAGYRLWASALRKVVE
jgi:lysophospholipase L1-like esterase